MIRLAFELNNDTVSVLKADKEYVAFSGDGENRNNPSSGSIANSGPIPVGSYYIVDRESGGMMGKLKDKTLHRDQWFVLYRDDDSIDDETFVSSVKRGQFRLHPLGPRRMSTGCIVLQFPERFPDLRGYLLSQPAEKIPNTGIRTYGMVDVNGPKIDILDPRYRRGGGSGMG
ncbi:DUF2778 domain-containing protein [Methylobacterium sp. BTF04]|uniref:DUF2778 domain-containing protein n=1 Tax=Methylobacterium sp. BTF04 TaxID=2708300 RepID=UPI0013D8A236|nr:DUF2778 domain-containing protein [Methylobacterium sp. BTF04]NEU11206.1 DUF2778 domain-containing protein [Methylobacterium sp. BTF04]